MKPEKKWGNNLKNQSHSIVWLIAFILAVLVVATVSVLGTCIYDYAHRSDCQISLYDGQMQETTGAVFNNAASQKNTNSVIQSVATQYSGADAKQESDKNAFAVEDTDQVWKTQTAIELFKSDYQNADGVTTVKSADGSKVIAPGTEGSYTFSLKNTGDMAANYKIWVEATLNSNIEGAPIETRMSSDDGWLLGGKNTWEQAEDLNGVSAAETIDAGKTAEYTIYWQWPFESGDDAADTNLADASGSVDQEMSYTVTIYTMTAAATGDGTENGNQTGSTDKNFLHAVKTDDGAQMLLWIVVLVCAAGVLACLLILRKRMNDGKYGQKQSNQRGK